MPRPFDRGRGTLLAAGGLVLLLAPALFLLNLFDVVTTANSAAGLMVPVMLLSLAGLAAAALGVRRLASNRLSAIVQTCCYAVPVAIVVFGGLVDLYMNYVAEYDGGFGGMMLVFAGCLLQVVLAAVAFTTALFVAFSAPPARA